MIFWFAFIICIKFVISTSNDGSSKYTFNVSDIAYGDLKLSINGNMIIVKKRHNCHYSVISEYPVAKDATNPEAKIEKGILTITAWESKETEKLPESRIHKIPIIMNANGTAMANEYPYFSITKNVSEILVEDLEVSFIEDPFSSNKIRIKKRREPCSYTVIKRLPKANNSYPEKGKLMKNGMLIVTASHSKNGKRNFDSIPIEKE